MDVERAIYYHLLENIVNINTKKKEEESREGGKFHIFLFFPPRPTERRSRRAMTLLVSHLEAKSNKTIKGDRLVPM